MGLGTDDPLKNGGNLGFLLLKSSVFVANVVCFLACRPLLFLFYFILFLTLWEASDLHCDFREFLGSLGIFLFNLEFKNLGSPVLCS